jgi:hypothetical protein
VVLPTERPHDGAWQNGAYLVQADGPVQGYQTKNQVPLEEDPSSRRARLAGCSSSTGWLQRIEGLHFELSLRAAR